MLVPIFTKARTRFGVVYPSQETKYAINFNDDKSITVYCNRIAGTTFKVGDTATYDSYNLVYTGVISKITDKAVTIIAYGKTVHRLSLDQFAWRNFDFNAAKVAAENSDTMMYI